MIQRAAGVHQWQLILVFVIWSATGNKTGNLYLRQTVDITNVNWENILITTEESKCYT